MGVVGKNLVRIPPNAGRTVSTLLRLLIFPALAVSAFINALISFDESSKLCCGLNFVFLVALLWATYCASESVGKRADGYSCATNGVPGLNHLFATPKSPVVL